MGTPDGAYGIPEGMAEFRILPRQRQNLLIGTAVLVAIAVVGWLILLRTKSWGIAANIATAASLCVPMYLYYCLAYGLAYTRLGPDGISGRSLARRYEYRWEQIANVARRAYTYRGVTTYTVIVTTTDGDRIRLGAPVSGGIMGDPEFDIKYARIREAWQAATGHTGPEDDTKSIWTRGLILLTAGLILQAVAGAAFAAILATDGPAAGLAATAGIVIILLVLEIAVPLYLGHRRRARARDGLARLGLPVR